jgi:cysteinyl-tRNA synthetase
MEAGARVDVAPYKKGPMDFVLWKPSKPGEPAWPSPPGIAAPGRPGWHIECSAMADRWLWQEPKLKGLLSEAGLRRPHVFDIHGGGIDLVFPHHENEIAQSRCAHGTPVMANVWMHNGFLQVEGEKMSKSLGNFVTINELLNTTKFGGRRWPGEVLRLAMLMTHYRQPMDFSVRSLEVAEKILGMWYRAIGEAVAPETSDWAIEIELALRNDLNTPSVITKLNSMFDVVEDGEDSSAAGRFKAAAHLLGFLETGERGWKTRLHAGVSIDDQRVSSLITARNTARKAKNFKEADRVRDELSAMGIQLKDAKDPTTGEIVTTWEVKR